MRILWFASAGMFWISTPRRGRLMDISPRLGNPSAVAVPALLPPAPAGLPMEGQPLLLLAKRLPAPLKSNSPVELALLLIGDGWERKGLSNVQKS